MRVVKVAEYTRGRVYGRKVNVGPVSRYIVRMEVNRNVTRMDLERIVSEMKKRIGWGRIRSAVAKGKTIFIEIEPYGYVPYQAAVAVLTFLPEILSIVGMILIAASLYISATSVPQWVIIMGVIGIILIIPMLVRVFGLGEKSD